MSGADPCTGSNRPGPNGPGPEQKRKKKQCFAPLASQMCLLQVSFLSFSKQSNTKIQPSTLQKFLAARFAGSCNCDQLYVSAVAHGHLSKIASQTSEMRKFQPPRFSHQYRSHYGFKQNAGSSFQKSRFLDLKPRHFRYLFTRNGISAFTDFALNR